MKSVFLASLLLCSASSLWAAKAGEEANPLDGVITLLSDLEEKAIKEGAEEDKTYNKYREYCDERARELGFEIKHAMKTKEEIEAKIAEEKAHIEKLKARIANLAADVAKDARELQKAVELRRKERKNFLAEEKELMETIEIVKEVIRILEEKKQPSMLQVKNAGNLAQALSVMVQASLIGTADASKLTAFVQSAQGTEDSADDEALGAPAASSEGRTVIDLLEDLQEKAENQLQTARKTETDAQQGFDMMKASLSNEVKLAQKDMDTVKNGIVTDEEEKSVADGELVVEEKDLATDTEAQRELRHACLSRAEAYEEEVRNMHAELDVLKKAQQILKESVASLAQLSFVQVSSTMEQSSSKVVRFVRDLGRKQGSSALVQLAANMMSALHSTGGDPFGNVKSMITDMIARLEKEASSAARKKEYCDKELVQTKDKKDDTQDAIHSLMTKIDRMESKNGKLTGDEKWLQEELSKLGMTQAEMDKLRAEEKAKYGMSREMIEKSLSGTERAIKVLKEYYAQDGNDKSGVAGSIITLLEDVAAKFNTWLMDVKSEENEAASEYQQLTEENKVEKAADETDLGHIESRVKKIKKRIAETSTDEQSEEEQLDAVSDYLSQIEKDCTAKPNTYEARQKARQNEIEGLTQALEILNSEASLIQSRVSRKQLRGDGQRGVIAA